MLSAKQLQRENDQLREQLQQQQQRADEKYAELELLYKKLLERLFGSRSERYIDNPNQLKLDFGVADGQIDDAVEGLRQAVDERDAEDATADDIGKRRPRRKKKPRNEKFPAHLPREVVDVDLSDEEKQSLNYLGFDSTETLKSAPLRLTVIETRYHKYAKPNEVDAGVLSPPRQAGLVEGNRYDTSIAAEIIANRYGYHLPFYRQQDMFAGSGWTPSRSTLLNIQTSAAELLRPLILFFALTVRRDCVIGTDDTGVKLLLPKHVPDIDPDDPKSRRVREVLSEAITAGERKYVNAKVWAYRGVNIPLNVFDFTVSRHRDGPDLFLVNTNYSGTLLGDCYGANTGIHMRSCGSILHAACVSHARRHVRDALPNHQTHGKALMRMFNQLYDIEDRGRTMEADARGELRQSEAKPIWESLRQYMDTQTDDLLPKDQMSSAIGYLRNQWSALVRYLEDPLIPIDNNETEQLMKQVAIGRKNWLFVGSVQAGYRSMDLMTLVSSAIRNDLDVRGYVQGVLDALLSGETNYERLLPHVWAQENPGHIREYRKIERATRHEAKSTAREARRSLATALIS